MSKSIPAFKKLRITLAAGALPGTTLAAIGDFLAPRGGYVLPFAVGVLAAVVFFCLLLLGNKTPKQLTDGDEFQEGWWDGPRHQQLGMWVLAAIALTGLLFGSISHARAQSGGYLGSRFDAVGTAQTQLGLLQESVRQQTRTADAVEQVRDTVKRESSEDPVKELANMGQPWSVRGFQEAVDRKDLRSIELYLKGGMQLGNTHNFLYSLIYRRNYEALELFQRYNFSVSEKDCRSSLRHHGFFAVKDDSSNADSYAARSAKAKIDTQAVAMYRQLCSSYPSLAPSILTVNTCEAVTEKCRPETKPKDEIEAALRQYQHYSYEGCLSSLEERRNEHRFCKKLLKELD